MIFVSSVISVLSQFPPIKLPLLFSPIGYSWAISVIFLMRVKIYKLLFNYDFKMVWTEFNEGEFNLVWIDGYAPEHEEVVKKVKKLGGVFDGIGQIYQLGYPFDSCILNI